MPQVKFKRQICYKGATYHKGEVASFSMEDMIAIGSFAVDTSLPEQKPHRNVVMRPEVKIIESAKNTAITNEDQTIQTVAGPGNISTDSDKKVGSKPKTSNKGKARKSKTSDKKVITK